MMLAGACGADRDPSPSDPGASPPAALPEVAPYRVAEGEPAPDVKQAATAYLETLLTYGDGEGTAEAAAERIAAAGLPAEPAQQAADLLEESASGAAEVVYPQLGGLTDTQASIMAVTTLHRLGDGELTSTTRTIDVRLTRTGEEWAVSEIASTGAPGTAPSPSTSPSPLASSGSTVGAQVVDAPAIHLPDTARWDIEGGGLDDRMLQILLDLSADHELSVAVLSTGHPHNVFDSASVSNHTNGRAVDIWAIDGTPVAEYARDGSGGDNPARRLMEQALALGSDEVGGPWSFSTPDGATFTNTVHQDHLHVGFKR
ncbi:hypothetical protein ACFOVU_09860 [Nocardiopsis sediminis]|uniref:Uncharacterized protein n=1 Tax=Nocardiopsis sediminis TaxID=1778267 RepID=A0ABV8FJB6_9ACTN